MLSAPSTPPHDIYLHVLIAVPNDPTDTFAFVDEYMSGALPSQSPPLPSRSHNMSDSDRDDEITRDDYSNLPPEERPGNKHQQKGGYNVSYASRIPGQDGMPTINYAKHINPSYTATPQFGSTAAPMRSGGTGRYSPPSGGFQYAEPPGTIRYSRKPQIKNPQTYDPDEDSDKDKKRKKKDKEKKDKKDRQAMPPPPMPGAYNFATMEPGASFPSFPTGPSNLSNYPMPPPPPIGSRGGEAPYPTGPSMFPTGSMPPPPPPPPRGFDPGATIMEFAPEKSRRNKSPEKRGRSDSNRLSTSSLYPDMRGPSPGGDLGRRLNRLSVSGNRPDVMAGSMPPPSPLLEPYRGTWQSMGGIPSPMMHPIDAEYEDYSDGEFEELSPQQSNRSMRLPTDIKVIKVEPKRRGSRDRSSSKSTRKRSSSPKKKKDKPKKTVSMYEAEQDAKDIARELVRSEPDVRVLTEILPELSHDEMVELQMAYKRVVKQGGQGIKMSNHIKTKLPRGPFNTLAYVTALGRWESEGYWANYWYQGDTSKRELLIESLMGRKNNEMKLIKESFKDKRYGNSLEKCMDKELRKDKFRVAVLMALEGKRQEEGDVWPREYVQQDVSTWIKALRGKEGGETAMLEVCIKRSDRHLRECLKVFEQQEERNFAKEVLGRSSNLVVSLNS